MFVKMFHRFICQAIADLIPLVEKIGMGLRSRIATIGFGERSLCWERIAIACKMFAFETDRSNLSPKYSKAWQAVLADPAYWASGWFPTLPVR